MDTQHALVRASLSSGKALRLARISDPATRRAHIVPMDHSVTVGPLGPVDHTERMVSVLAGTGINAVVLHRGRINRVPVDAFTSIGLIVHLSAGTSMSLDTDAKVLVSGVEAAVRSGADAVSIHVNIGSQSERQQLADFAAVARECDVLGVPLLAMMYARGPQQNASSSANTLAHLAAIATDLGADMIKLDYAGSPSAMQSVVASTPVPVYVAGGATVSDDAAIALGAEVMSSGVAGLSFGRNVFNATNPVRVATALARIVHKRIADSDRVAALA
ncbi:2-amino-3,7-dideoxy-D-threo-hept-6-ulosonate synthase [Gordonia sp. (in: high G+C Gram-positive bacteria)]|jgi:predicted phospho-2-dehydro-3-deoxyheptonate aldolase|uniref:2-amino-3,7-dideoxy-D-threo-hept-6-ulosonate synthase n=1 Tax=Gordonia sp. (in: high G+C Gram-positive bacteria) TaxID=84139 RepID=UPI0026194A18|nr:2-amino-3,7-dideoxy-D-threo-hept-6-ulosonate synthase [Gordonia sp. (in: high G+C Gram-positive bacteria)]HMS76241.1 2-amino-3,7-dideoxy-D-threo-hept-6-ulosonate synthase [Gordonia sp. (in: high G+C Gram-positive bacteria)]